MTNFNEKETAYFSAQCLVFTTSYNEQINIFFENGKAYYILVFTYSIEEFVPLSTLASFTIFYLYEEQRMTNLVAIQLAFLFKEHEFFQQFYW